MKLIIHNTPYTKWYTRMHCKYKTTLRSRLIIDGKLCYIDGFEGKLSKVHINGEWRKLKIKEVRKYRYAALKERRTICNRDKPSNRYKYRAGSRDCESCFICSRCSMVLQGWRKKSQVIIKDLMMISEFFEENEE